MEIESYRQPESWEELVKDLLDMTEGSAVLSGGTDLIIRIRNREGVIPVLLSVCKVKELYSISLEQDELVIGAMEHFDAIANDENIRKDPYLDALRMASAHVGSQQVRNKGTIGGNVGNASVAGDLIPVLVLYHAKAEILQGGGAVRTVPVENLIAGASKTTLGPTEMITHFRIPLGKMGRRSCFMKLGGRDAVTIADISLAMSWDVKNGSFSDVEGVLGAVDTHPIVLDEVSSVLDKTKGGADEWRRLADSLSERIRSVRLKRTRPPKLRIREGEKEYKERAVRGLVSDVGRYMESSLELSGAERMEAR